MRSYIRTPEIRAKVSAAVKMAYQQGRLVPYLGLKGMHLSPKTEFKLGSSSPAKGIKRPDLAERNRSLRGTHLILSELRLQQLREQGKLMGLSRKGKSHYQPSHSPESRAKMSASHKGGPSSNASFKKGNVPVNKGILMSIEQKQQLSEIAKEQYRNGRTPWNKGIKWEQPWDTSEHRAMRIAKSIKGSFKRPTTPEKKVIDIIRRNVLPYKYTGDGTFIIAGLNPDFVNVNGDKIALDVFGDYWHTLKADRISYTEKGRRAILAEYGWSLIVLWERDINTLEETEIVRMIKEGA